MFPKLQELVYDNHFVNAVQNRIDTTNIRPMLSNDERELIKRNIKFLLGITFDFVVGTKFGIQVFETSTYRKGYEQTNGQEHGFDGNKVFLVCEIFPNKDVLKTLIWKSTPTIKGVEFYIDSKDIYRYVQRTKETTFTEQTLKKIRTF